jgi:hypothetical protein
MLYWDGLLLRVDLPILPIFIIDGYVRNHSSMAATDAMLDALHRR